MLWHVPPHPPYIPAAPHTHALDGETLSQKHLSSWTVGSERKRVRRRRHHRIASAPAIQGRGQGWSPGILEGDWCGGMRGWWPVLRQSLAGLRSRRGVIVRRGQLLSLPISGMAVSHRFAFLPVVSRVVRSGGAVIGTWVWVTPTDLRRRGCTPPHDQAGGRRRAVNRWSSYRRSQLT